MNMKYLPKMIWVNQVYLFAFRLVCVTPPSIDDFNIQSLLGEGSYGKVYKANYRKTGRAVAIKTIESFYMDEPTAFAGVLREQRILLLAKKENCHFLTRLFASFSTEHYTCLAMEFVEGGDVASHLVRNGMSQERRRNEFYRLKPNSMWNFAVYGPGNVYTVYPYTRSVDWCGLGVCIYLMRFSQIPFTDDADKIIHNIVYEEPIYPPSLTPEIYNIITQLLTKTPYRRLGSDMNGAEDVKKSDFFEGLDWEALQKKEVQPPFVGKIKVPEICTEGIALEPPELTLQLLNETNMALKELDYPVCSESSETET
ncbi:hypothetical protein XELAEV_18009444mg [Xenopus laevis]|uniref:Protein kinase domain-containing protein n=1 Tax=Xenopus laevis TaxID=8355 RepID=A0A974DTK9_XENLA|nr:hypothetical protein XELAEV_18009444mg [Xenopus laevis]